MNCRKALSSLSAYHRDELSHSTKERLLQHLEACPDCQKKSAVVGQISQTVRHLPQHELSDDFNMRLFERIHNSPRVETPVAALLPKAAPSAVAYWGRYTAPAVAAISLVIFALTLFPVASDVDPRLGAGYTTITPGAVSSVSSKPVVFSEYQQNVRALRFEHSLVDSLAAAASSSDGRIFHILGWQKKKDFGAFGYMPVLREASGSLPAGSSRHYVLPAVSPTRGLVRDAAF